jgi:hypothetical protein
MKKWILPIVILLIVSVNAALSTKFHYPELPFENKTKYEVANLGTTSDLPLSKVTQQDGYLWFVTDDSQDLAEQSLKKRMTRNGWEFVDQNGLNYFFKKDDEKIVIKCHEWTSNYLLFQLPLGL